MTNVVSLKQFIRDKAEEALCIVEGRSRKIADVVEEMLPSASPETKLRIINEATKLYLDSLKGKTNEHQAKRPRRWPFL